jgi:pSer/pThr/pTyr-binding forkhead associated (FHA) protein
VAVILEVTAGPLTGKRIAVMGGQTVTVGRTPRSNFAVPHDTFMSGLHFSVECGPKGCLLTDQKSSNGTFVNKARVTQAVLGNGDEVRSGQTIFVVRVLDEATLPGAAKPAAIPAAPVAPLPLPVRQTERTAALDEPATKSRAPQPAAVASSPAAVTPPPLSAPQSAPVSRSAPGNAALTIGSWSFTTMPERWIPQGDYGIQRDVADAFPSSVVVTEESLGEGVSLQQYVETQLSVLRQYLRDPQIEATLPPKIQRADETIAVDVRYKTKEGQGIFYRRVYSRLGKSVGILTFTTLEDELNQLRPAMDAILSGAAFAPRTQAQK